MDQATSAIRAGLAAACLLSAAGAAGAQATRLAWSSSGPIAGMHCTQLIEGAAPPEFTWRDNFLCADRDIGLRWSPAGPLSGMRCTQIIEGAEPLQYTWRDNYLCLPQTSPVTLAWSPAGPIAGRSCVQIHEGRDPYGWHDNYLCWTEELRRADLLTITEIRNVKPASGLDAAGEFVFGLIGAGLAVAGSGGVSLGDIYSGAKYGVEVGRYLDQAFSGQDDLIVKIDGRTVLPVGRRYQPVQAGEVIRPNLRASIMGAAQLQLVEWDSPSDWDNLGIWVILGGRTYSAEGVLILAPDPDDGSIYAVSYRVEAGRGDPLAVPRAMLCGTNQCEECARLDCAGHPHDNLDRDGDKPDLIRCPAHFTEAGFIEYPQVFENVFLRVCRHMAAR